MILGLPVSTFLWAFAPVIIALVLSIAYGLTFKDDDQWWTFEDMFWRKKRRGNDGK